MAEIPIPEELREKAMDVWMMAGAAAAAPDRTLSGYNVIAAALLAERLAERARCAELPELREDRYTTTDGPYRIGLHCKEISPGRTMQDHIHAYEEARRACEAEGGGPWSSDPDKSPTLRGIKAVVLSVLDGYAAAIRSQS